MNAEGQLTGQTYGNGVATTQNFNALTGRLTSIQAGANASVASFAYMWDTVGNLQWRKDPTQNLEEFFQYDLLNRVTQADITGGTTKTHQYDSIGNITFKSDTGTYSYPAPGSARPHAVSSIAGTLNTSFTYDANGNMLTGNGRTIVWSTDNMPATITRGTSTLTFHYDGATKRRLKQFAASGTTSYFDRPDGSTILAEKFVGTGGTTQWKHYIQAGGGIVAVVTKNSTGPDQTRYVHRDHLGSTAVITNETGAVVERLSYDVWGKRRYPNGQDDPAGAINSLMDRGYTGHEHLEEVSLIHMNGRVYDPEIGRFLSADQFVQDAFDSQAFNRYSYVNNNPLAYTDPSGFFPKGLFKAIGKFIKAFWKPLVAIAIAILMPQLLPSLGIALGGTMGSIITGALSGFVSSAITSGFDIRSMLIGAVAGGIGGGIGDYFADVGGEIGAALEGVDDAVNTSGSVGGWGGAIGRAAGGRLANELSGRFASLVAKVVLGSSHHGSGNFANGGSTLAFDYATGGGVTLISGGTPYAIEGMKQGMIYGGTAGALSGLSVVIMPGGAAIAIPSMLQGAAGGAVLGGGLGFFGGLMVDVYDSIVRATPPDNARDPNGPKAPGKPTEAEGFSDPRGGENWVKNPNPGRGGAGHGWLDNEGRVWVPTGQQPGRTHGGPHWDVQIGKGHVNVRPGQHIDDVLGR